MNKKSVVEDALFQIRNLEEALKENAKGILSSTMKNEISSLVKESLREQEEIDVEDEEVVEPEGQVDDVEDVDLGVEPMATDDMEDDDMEDMGMEDDDAIDMTGADMSDVIKVFKSMDDEDGVIVKRDANNNIRLSDSETGADYFIQLSEQYQDELDEQDDDLTLDETLYEIEMDDMDSRQDVYRPDVSDDEGWSDKETQRMWNEQDEDGIVYRPDVSDDEGWSDKETQRMWNEEMDMDMDMDPRRMSRRHSEMDETPMYEIEMDDMDSRQDVYRPDVSDDEGWSDKETQRMWNEEMDMDMDFEEMDMDPDPRGGRNSRHYEDMDIDHVMESKFKSKGVGMGSPKFKYGQVMDYKTTKQKEGKKMINTGSAKKFSYKDGENLDGEYRPIKKRRETTEASRTLGAGRKFGRNGLPKPKAAPRHISENEVELLKSKNEEYRKALNLFRTKLNEVAIFNSNLAYATRLFTEHSTTKQEKINILRRFDNVETLKESKSLYKSLKDEFSSEKTKENSINESFEKSVTKTPVSGSAVNLIESKTYENPQFLRMKDLMGKIK
jgi:hypothetical protein